ncbi:MAG TPA: RNA polymerase sigma factor [Acidimicrobiia bacterium]
MSADRDPRDDVALLAAVSDGDTGALRTLYLRHSPWLSVRLRRRCNDDDVVSDVLQDTFVAVWRGADRFQGEGEVGAWLWGIGIRRLISRLRTGTRLSAPLSDVNLESELGVEDEVLVGVEYGRLGPALASLSPELREVVQATILDGLTTKETARLLGIPQGTVKTRAMRARAQLREHLIEGAT